MGLGPGEEGVGGCFSQLGPLAAPLSLGAGACWLPLLGASAAAPWPSPSGAVNQPCSRALRRWSPAWRQGSPHTWALGDRWMLRPSSARPILWGTSGCPCSVSGSQAGGLNVGQLLVFTLPPPAPSLVPSGLPWARNHPLALNADTCLFLGACTGPAPYAASRAPGPGAACHRQALASKPKPLLPPLTV